MPHLTAIGGLVARVAVGLAVCSALAACVTLPDTPVGPPTVIVAPGEPAPPQARLYADCIAASTAAGTFEKEPGRNFLRFTCTGTPARAFYEGLAAWSAEIGSTIIAEGRTWRFTQKLIRDPVGVDVCSTDDADDYRCTVILNVGEFLAAN